ncbi:respiratory nitrate reductase subunit gamma [Escherichia coli]
MIQYSECLMISTGYICAIVFFLGSWLRYDYGQYAWRASSSQMLDKRGMVIWSNLFISAFWDFLRALVRHVNAALDVRVVFASGSGNN